VDKYVVLLGHIILNSANQLFSLTYLYRVLSRQANIFFYQNFIVFGPIDAQTHDLPLLEARTLNITPPIQFRPL